MKKSTLRYITVSAMTAALYVVLSLISNALGLASLQVQVRFSEALTILPAISPYSIAGVFIGCLITNILCGCAIFDIVFGSLTTLMAAILTYFLTRRLSNAKKWVAPLPPIILNSIIIPFILYFGYGLKPLWLSFITVFIGEFISAGIFGFVLYSTLVKYKFYSLR